MCIQILAFASDFLCFQLSVQAVIEAWITSRRDSTTKPNIAAATLRSMTTASTHARQVQTPECHLTCICWSTPAWPRSKCLCLTSQACYEGGKEVIVVPKTTASSDSPWFGLAIYAWSGWVQLPQNHLEYDWSGFFAGRNNLIVSVYCGKKLWSTHQFTVR